MKKTILLFALSLTCISFSQKMYVNLKAGYDFQSGSQRLGIDYNEVSKTDTAINYSLGKGFNVEGAFGYKIQEYFGVELGISYLNGSTFETKQTFTNGNFNSTTVSGKMLKIIPSIVINAGYDKINPYAKMGLVIGTNGQVIEEFNQRTSATQTKNTILKKEGGIDIGFKTSLGVLYSVNKKISLFGEANLTSLTFTPKKGSFTKYYIDGIDKLSTLNVNSREIEYVESGTSGLPVNSNEPQKTLTRRLPFSSLGINLGIQYNF